MTTHGFTAVNGGIAYETKDWTIIERPDSCGRAWWMYRNGDEDFRPVFLGRNESPDWFIARSYARVACR